MGPQRISSSLSTKRRRAQNFCFRLSIRCDEMNSSNPMHPVAPVNYTSQNTLPWGYPRIPPYSPGLAISAPNSDALHTPALTNPLPVVTPPEYWSKEDVIRWLRWSEEEFSLNRLEVDKFSMNGKGLCILTKEDFKSRASYAGDVLYGMLERLKRKDYSSTCQPFMSYMAPLDANYRLSPVPSPSYHHSPNHRHPAHLEVRLNVSTEADNNRQQESHPVQLASPSSDPMLSDCSGGDLRKCRLPSSEDDKCTCTNSSTVTKCEQNLNDQHEQKTPTQSTVNQATPLDLSILNSPISKPNSDCRLLWEFLYFLLSDEMYKDYIAWDDETNQIFRILKPNTIAKLWGRQKNRPNMTYDKLSRALRFYYKMKILQKLEGQKLTYRFLKKREDLQSSPEYSKLNKTTSVVKEEQTENKNSINSSGKK